MRNLKLLLLLDVILFSGCLNADPTRSTAGLTSQPVSDQTAAGQLSSAENGGNVPTAPYTYGSVYAASVPAAIASMPGAPTGTGLVDYADAANSWVTLALNPYASGPNLPIMKVLSDRIVYPTFVGSNDDCGALCTIGTAIGATLLGRPVEADASVNWFNKIYNYYGSYQDPNGITRGNIFATANRSSMDSIDSWNQMQPAIAWAQLLAQAPNFQGQGKPLFLSAADMWTVAANRLADGAWANPHWAPSTMTATSQAGGGTGVGLGYLTYQAYLYSQDANYLAAAKLSMQAYEDGLLNGAGEHLEIFGPTLAARMNAEQGTTYNVDLHLSNLLAANKLLLAQTSGGRDFYGLLGGPMLWNGWAMAIYTWPAFVQLSVLPRYMPQYTQAIGRMLNSIAYNMGMIFPKTMPTAMQTDYSWYQQTQFNIGYEGVAGWHADNEAAPHSPLAGRGTAPPARSRGAFLAASWYTGYLANILRLTDNPNVLGFDCVVGDAAHAKAYPTVLYYNSSPQAQNVTISLGTATSDILDAEICQSIAFQQTGDQVVSVPPVGARLLVVAPSQQALITNGKRTLLGDAVIDWGL